MPVHVPRSEPSFFDDVLAFHRKFQLEPPPLPALLIPELGSLRNDRLIEEYEEYLAAVTHAMEGLHPLKPNSEMTTQGLEMALDALVDLVYIALGTAVLHGFDFNEAWRRVHAANMTKVRALRADESRHGSVYDVIKPSGFVAPSHRDLVEKHTYNTPR